MRKTRVDKRPEVKEMLGMVMKTRECLHAD